MKIRIGLGLGAWPFTEGGPRRLLELVERCEALSIDSLWFSDRIIGPTVTLDPITLMAFMAARAPTMMFGTSVLVLPTRNPVVLAKELATLDYLSGGRLLLTVGLGAGTSQDLEATGVPRRERAPRTDEAIVLMRKLWSGEPVTFQGRFYSVQDATVLPKPTRPSGPPIWIGGRSDAALRRVARLGDGWLVSSVTVEEVAAGIQEIRRCAQEYGRQVPEDHYGVLLPFCIADDPTKAQEMAQGRLGQLRPDVLVEQTSALGTPRQIRDRLDQYLAIGVTKFVMRPASPPELWEEQLELLARELVEPVQTPFTSQELATRRGASGL